MRPEVPWVVEITVSPELPSFRTARIRDLLRYAADQEQLSGELGVWICKDDEIAELHQQFMNISGPTDVLSFPGDGDYLGDIAVSFDTAAAQAREIGHSTERELAYLCLHGLLHLSGYDDLSPDEREKMIARQDALITAFEREFPHESI